MCQFLSGWISNDGRTVYPGDLVHHERGADIHNISEQVACPWEWLPGEARPEVRVSPNAAAQRATARWLAELLVERFGDHSGAVAWCLSHLSPNVKMLDLQGTGVTTLPELPNVKWLYLQGTGVTTLPELPNVETLYLRGTGVTTLPELPNVKWLDLHGTGVCHEIIVPANCRVIR